MGQKSTSGGTQTTTTEPPAYLKPYLQQAAGTAQNQYATGGPQIYQGSSVADFSQPTMQALQGTVQRASQGSPLVDQASNYVQQGLQQPIGSQFGTQNPYANPVGFQQVSNANVTAGNQANPYANAQNPYGGASNPYLDATYDKAFGKGMQSIESQYARGGRNIGASQPVAGDLAANLASQIYAPAYENERNRQLAYDQQTLGIGANSFEQQQGRQLQAGLANQSSAMQAQLANQSAGLQSGLAGQSIGAQSYDAGQNRQLSDISQQRSLQQNLLGYASPLAAQDYMDLAQLQGAGAAYDQQSQAQLNDRINIFNQLQARPEQALDTYIQRLQGMPGASVTQTLPTQYRNVGSGILGGALGGSQLTGGNLWGALGGGLLGLFG